MKSFKLILAVLLSGSLCLSPEPVSAQDTGSGLDFLNIGPSARILAIGEATAAVPTGPSSIYSNPSLLSFETASGLDINYTLWVSNVNNQFAAVHLKRKNITYGFGIYNSRTDEFEARHQPGPSAGSFSISYLSISAAAAYRAGPLSVGVASQYLREEIFQLRANGFALNTGASLRLFRDRVMAGVSVNNIGEMEELDVVSTPLPTVLKSGLSVQFIEFVTPGSNDLPVLLSLHTDWSHSLKERSSGDYTSGNTRNDFLTIGFTADIAELFSIQGAYRQGPTERPLSFGMGISINPVRVNYALVPFSTGFGTVHSFGLQYKF